MSPRVLRIAALALLLAASAMSSGCVALIAARQRAALPPGYVGEARVTVNISGVGGGSLHVKDAIKGADGSLAVGEYHSEINTAGGVVKVDIIDANLDATKKAKK